MKANGRVEICGMCKGTWIRVEGEVQEDTRREAHVAMMDDNLMTVFYFACGTATIYSFTNEPKVIKL